MSKQGKYVYRQVRMAEHTEHPDIELRRARRRPTYTKNKPPRITDSSENTHPALPTPQRLQLGPQRYPYSPLALLPSEYKLKFMDPGLAAHPTSFSLPLLTPSCRHTHRLDTRLP